MGKSQNVLRENMEKSQILYCPTSSDGMMFYAIAILPYYNNVAPKLQKIIHFSACREENCTFFRTILPNFALKSRIICTFADALWLSGCGADIMDIGVF